MALHLPGKRTAPLPTEAVHDESPDGPTLHVARAAIDGVRCHAAKLEQAVAAAGLRSSDGTDKRATVVVTGRLRVRYGYNDDSDYTAHAVDFGRSTEPMPQQVSLSLRDAIERKDYARVVAISERHATLHYPSANGFTNYGDDEGFHFDSIDDIRIDWH